MRRALDDVATRRHVIVVLEDEHVLLFRELRGGTVRHLAPGAATHPGETPGKAAARAAREQLGVTVDVTELLFANTENGVEHFFFVASPNERVVLDSDVQRYPSEHLAATAVKRTALLAYPVRPVEVARRLLLPRRSATDATESRARRQHRLDTEF